MAAATAEAPLPSISSIWTHFPHNPPVLPRSESSEKSTATTRCHSISVSSSASTPPAISLSSAGSVTSSPCPIVLYLGFTFPADYPFRRFHMATLTPVIFPLVLQSGWLWLRKSFDDVTDGHNPSTHFLGAIKTLREHVSKTPQQLARDSDSRHLSERGLTTWQ